MEELNQKIDLIDAKLAAIETLLEKSFEEWTLKERNIYGDHQSLRIKEQQLRTEKQQLQEKELVLLKKVPIPAPGRAYEDAFRLPFIKAVYGNNNGIVISAEYFSPDKAVRKYTKDTGVTHGSLIQVCQQRLAALNWPSYKTKFEDIEIDGVLRCHFKHTNPLFDEPAKILVPSKDHKLESSAAFAKQISDNKLEGEGVDESDQPNGYIVVEITSSCEEKHLAAKIDQLEKDLLFLLLKHQEEFGDNDIEIETIIGLAFLICPISTSMKKAALEELITAAIVARKETHPLVFRMYSLSRFARYFTAPGLNGVVKQISDNVLDNASSSSSSSVRLGRLESDVQEVKSMLKQLLSKD